MWTTSTELVVRHGAWGRIVLDVEQMRINQALMLPKRYPEGVKTASASCAMDSTRRESCTISWRTARSTTARPAFPNKREEPVNKVPT